MAEKESAKVRELIISELTHFTVDFFPMYFNVYTAFILVTFDFFCVAVVLVDVYIYMSVSSHALEPVCVYVSIYPALSICDCDCVVCLSFFFHIFYLNNYPLISVSAQIGPKRKQNTKKKTRNTKGARRKRKNSEN